MFSFLNKNKKDSNEDLHYSISYAEDKYNSTLTSYENDDIDDDCDEYSTNKEIMDAVELYFETYLG